MSIKTALKGDPFDLMILADLFPASSDPAVVADANGHYLVSSAISGDLAEDAVGFFEQAQRVLRTVMGAARILNGNLRPVELDGYFYDASGHRHIVVQVDTVTTRSYVPPVTLVINGKAAPPPLPAAPAFVRLAEEDQDVRDALNFLGKPGPLDWFDLYKVFEVVRESAFKSQVEPRKGAKRALIQTGWITEQEIQAFTGSANHPLASGDVFLFFPGRIRLGLGARRDARFAAARRGGVALSWSAVSPGARWRGRG